MLGISVPIPLSSIPSPIQMFSWEPSFTLSVLHSTPQKTRQGSAPLLELLKTTPTGHLRPGHQTCHVIPFLPFQESPRSALLCSDY